MSLPSKRQVDQQHLSLEGVRVLVVEDAWSTSECMSLGRRRPPRRLGA